MLGRQANRGRGVVGKVPSLEGDSSPRLARTSNDSCGLRGPSKERHLGREPTETDVARGQYPRQHTAKSLLAWTLLDKVLNVRSLRTILTLLFEICLPSPQALADP